MPFERLDPVNRKARCEFAGEDEVVADGRADIDIAALRRDPSNQIDKDVLFFRFVDIAFFVTGALAFPELVLIDAHAIVESVNRARH